MLNVSHSIKIGSVFNLMDEKIMQSVNLSLMHFMSESRTQQISQNGQVITHLSV